MYRPGTLEDECSSWRTVIYFNVVRSIKHILSTLEIWDDTIEDDSNSSQDEVASIMAPSTSRRDGAISDQPSPSASLMNSPAAMSSGLPGSPPRTEQSSTHPTTASKEAKSYQIANLRRRLSPLVAADPQLADRLSGGITVSGSGKGGVFVRSGWQARAIENAMIKTKWAKRASLTTETKASRESTEAVRDILVEDVGKMLAASRVDIEALWCHPTVKTLMAKRRLKLDEWSE